MCKCDAQLEDRWLKRSEEECMLRMDWWIRLMLSKVDVRGYIVNDPI